MKLLKNLVSDFIIHSVLGLDLAAYIHDWLPEPILPVFD